MVWRRPSPPSAAPSNHLFFYKNSASISISFLIFEGRAGAGGRERAAVISTEAGLVLRGIRDTQVFSQRALCRALWSPARFLFAKLHFQEVSDIQNLFQMPSQATERKKKTRGGRRKEGGCGEKGKGENVPLRRKR